MPIDPWLTQRFDLIRDVPSFEAAQTDPAEGARLLAWLADPEQWSPPAGVVSEQAIADGPHGPVPLRIFRPAGTPASALLWMHGGGFVMGSANESDSVIPGYELASRAGALVVSADYRLAVGGVRYPVPLDDTMAAWRWLVERGISDRLFIGGASAGATLALGACIRLRDAGERMPAGMLLAYLLAHFPVPPPDPQLAAELEKLPSLLRFSPQYQRGIVQNYLGRVDDLPADVVPGNHSVAGLPEAWIAPSEYDDLRPSADLLAHQLDEAGIPVHSQVARGMVHGHLGRGPSLEAVDANLDFFATALR